MKPAVFLSLAVFFVVLALPAAAQSLSAGQESWLAVATGYGEGEFLVADPAAAASPALRSSADRAGKDGVVPPHQAGWTLFAGVVVETDDADSLEMLGGAFGATGYEELEAAPGFWLVRTASVRAAADLAEVYRAALVPARAYLDAEPPRALRGTPNDPMFPQQWHLRNNSLTIADANVDPAWDAGITGAGVVIGVLEGGFETGHPDLNANYNAAASQNGGSSGHGTSVAGVAAAVGNNGTGVVGAAYGAQLSKQYFGGSTTTANAFNYRNDLNDIKNNSWGPFDDGTITYLSSVERTALENSTASGRGGLGELFVWAAGNGGTGDRVEYDPYASSRLTLAVGAIGDSDTRSSYNERGSSMLVVAQSSGNSRGITTTSSGGGYTSGFGGTSSSSPLGCGVVALMLEANPGLTWRDVQHVLVSSARRNHPGSSLWELNGAGRRINYNYGFGAMDAHAAVTVASTWAAAPASQLSSTGVLPVNRAIPDNNTTGINENVVVTDDLVIEFVEIVLNVDTTYVGDLRIMLTSPAGTESVVAVSRSDSQNDYVNYLFTSLRHWDERSPGTWNLRIADEGSGDLATWLDWELRIRGTAPLADQDLVLSAAPLTAQVNGSFTVQNGAPGTPTFLYYGKRAGSTSVPGLGVTLALRNAREAAPAVNSSGSGTATWNFVVPNKAGGRAFHLQAAQTGSVSNRLVVFVNP